MMKTQLYPFNELCFRVTLPRSTSFGWKDELWSFAGACPWLVIVVFELREEAIRLGQLRPEAGGGA